MPKVKKIVQDEFGDKYDSQAELEFAKQLYERKIPFTRQNKWILPSRFFRTHSWKDDFQLTYNKKKYIIDIKGWFNTHDKMKLSFVEHVHKIRVEVVTYKTTQKQGVKTYHFDWRFLNG